MILKVLDVLGAVALIVGWLWVIRIALTPDSDYDSRGR